MVYLIPVCHAHPLLNFIPIVISHLVVGLLEEDVKGGSKTERSVYSATKFIQLLGAHWWRRQLQGKCHVVAVSPGLIPGTGLPRGTSMVFSNDHPDAKSIPEGMFTSHHSWASES